MIPEPKTVCLASKSPAKLALVKAVFKKANIQGSDTDSGVSEQPVGDQETLQGAWNRLFAVKKKQPDCEAWIGIENGLVKRPVNPQTKKMAYYDVAYVVFLDKRSHSSVPVVTHGSSVLSGYSGNMEQYKEWQKKDPKFGVERVVGYWVQRVETIKPALLAAFYSIYRDDKVVLNGRTS
jgi:non-canonical (house-cleaning) NTP pyrophosphatase